MRSSVENELVQSAVLREIGIIGEAAGKLSREFREAHEEIPWHGMVGMRHRVVHDYFRISLTRVWDVVQDDIPELVRLITPLVPPDSR